MKSTSKPSDLEVSHCKQIAIEQYFQEIIRFLFKASIGTIGAFSIPFFASLPQFSELFTVVKIHRIQQTAFCKQQKSSK